MKVKEEVVADASLESLSSDKPQTSESLLEAGVKVDNKELAESFENICHRIDEYMDSEFHDKAWDQILRVRQECVLEVSVLIVEPTGFDVVDVFGPFK